MFRDLPTTNKYLYVHHSEGFPLSPNACTMKTFINDFHIKGPIEMRQFLLTHWAWRLMLFYFASEDFYLCWLFVFACTGLSHKNALEHQPSTSGDLAQVLIWIKHGEVSGLVMLSSGCFSAEQLPCSREDQPERQRCRKPTQPEAQKEKLDGRSGLDLVTSEPCLNFSAQRTREQIPLWQS